MIYLAADHAGYALKHSVKAALLRRDFRVVDLTPVRTPGDDYPAIAKAAVRCVLRGSRHRALLFCMTGTGMAIAANRYRGIRAAVGATGAYAFWSRRDDDANVLALGTKFLTAREAERIVLRWLATAPSNAARHRRRRGALRRIGS